MKRIKVIHGTKWAWQKYATEAAFEGSGPKLGFELAFIAQYCGNQFGGRGGELRCETSFGKVDRSISSSWAAEGLETDTDSFRSIFAMRGSVDLSGVMSVIAVRKPAYSPPSQAATTKMATAA